VFFRKYLANGSWNNAVKIWNVHSGECEKTFKDTRKE
jgi:hypothetical protein